MVEIFDAARFANDFALAVSANQSLSDTPPVRAANGGYKLEPATLAGLKERYSGLRDVLSVAGLDISALVAADLVRALEGGTKLESGLTEFIGQSLATLRGPLKEITTVVGREMQSRMVLILSKKDADLFAAETPHFGEQVFQAFKSSREDIEEAGKCLALGRATAAVFHLMRALEAAAQVVADKLGAAIKDGHGKGLPWGIIADNMKPKIDAMTKGSDEQIKWYRVQHHLVVVNRAWRVSTNHPKETYTPEQAMEVFNATKAFMKELAPLV